MKKTGFFLLIMSLTLLFSFRAAVENQPPVPPSSPGVLRALLIGCDHFVSQQDTYPAAENNLRLLSDVLLTDTRRYALIRSYASSIASPAVFEESVLSAFQYARNSDLSLLYISTHGVIPEQGQEGEPGLLLSDGTDEAVLYASEMKRILDEIPGKKLIIVDACNSGALIGKGMSEIDAIPYLTGPDYRVLCSAGGSEESWYFQNGGETSGIGASYFATVLAYGLGAQGDHAADQNADGVITLNEVYAHLTDNYAASSPQMYPQNCPDDPVFCYNPEQIARIDKAITDITFQDTLLSAGQTQVSFSFTVQKQAEVYYQIIYHQDGAWQFSQAQHYLDGEQADNTVLPGRKQRTLLLNTGGDAYGYAMIQLITLEDGQPVFQGARLLCVQPAVGEAELSVITGASFTPRRFEEIPILAYHNVPCGISVNILNEENRVVRRLCYETPSRPQQLSPSASSFYWDGRTGLGDYAPAGNYRVQIKVRQNGVLYTAESAPFALLDPPSL